MLVDAVFNRIVFALCALAVVLQAAPLLAGGEGPSADLFLSKPAVHAPEPAAAALSGVGLAGLGGFGFILGRWRSRRRFLQQLAAQGAASGGLVVVAPAGVSFAHWLNDALYSFTKRTLDIVVSLCALILLTPLFTVIAIAIYLDSPGPIFYRQERLGLGRRPFRLIKFRSMCVNADEVLRRDEQLRKEFEELYKLKHDPRVTRVGAFLRKTSLDELPQFINVLLGDISLVGPRPIVEREVEKYWPFEDRLFSVKPGLTGLWQVSGRNDTSYEERVRLDMRYIAERSLLLDLKIIAATVPALLGRCEGAY
jgi:lipopolysaccharide/colanic/teichoic acid biosynthesis glycosyltransferase